MHAHIVRHRKVRTFSAHVWTINKLLLMKEPMAELLPYIISACYPKMRHWMNHPIFSLPYYDSLIHVPKSFTFKAPFHTSTVTRLQKHNDRWLFDMLGHLQGEENLTATFTELQVTYNKVQHLDNEGYNLYTSATHMEFHRLVAELLEHFQHALDIL